MSLLNKIWGGHRAEPSEQNHSDNTISNNEGEIDKQDSDLINNSRGSSTSIPNRQDGSDTKHPTEAENEEENIKNLAFRHFLSMEATYKYQVVSERPDVVIPRSNPEKAVTFRELINMLFPTTISLYTEKVIISRTLNQRVSSDCYSNAQSLLDHSPFMFLFQRQEDGTITVVDDAISISFEKKDADGRSNFTHFGIKPIGSTENSVYARITIYPCVEGEDDLLTADSNKLSSPISFVMIFDVQSPLEDLKRFEEIESATISKIESHQSLAVFEDEVLRGMSGISYPGYNLGLGKWLLQSHRYYDAFVTFQRVYNCLKPQFFHLDEEGRHVFFETAYSLGVCLFNLGILDKAAYYAQLAMTGGREYIPSYVDILALACHNRVCYFMNQLRAQVQSNPNVQQEVNRLEQVVATAEKNHAVAETFDFSKLPLGDVLSYMFDVNPRYVQGATVIAKEGNEEHGRVFSKSEDVWTLDLYNCTDTIIYVYYSQVNPQPNADNPKEVDQSKFCQHNYIVLDVQSVTSNHEQPYVRINAMMPNFAQNDEKLFPGAYNIPHHASCIIGKNPVTKTFNRGQLEGIFAEAAALKKSFRIVEALRAYEYIHNALKVEYTKVSATEKDEEMFFDATYELGACLSALEIYERATYYLDWVQEGCKAGYAREYVDCLCNGGDVRALDIVNGIIQNTIKPSESEYQESFEYFMDFMLSRKAFLLISRESYDEAEDLLKEMLVQPRTKEFAQHELEHLNKIRK